MAGLPKDADGYRAQQAQQTLAELFPPQAQAQAPAPRPLQQKAAPIALPPAIQTQGGGLPGRTGPMPGPGPQPGPGPTPMPTQGPAFDSLAQATALNAGGGANPQTKFAYDSSRARGGSPAGPLNPYYTPPNLYRFQQQAGGAPTPATGPGPVPGGGGQGTGGGAGPAAGVGNAATSGWDMALQEVLAALTGTGSYAKPGKIDPATVKPGDKPGVAKPPVDVVKPVTPGKPGVDPKVPGTGSVLDKPPAPVSVPGVKPKGTKPPAVKPPAEPGILDRVIDAVTGNSGTKPGKITGGGGGGGGKPGKIGGSIGGGGAAGGAIKDKIISGKPVAKNNAINPKLAGSPVAGLNSIFPEQTEIAPEAMIRPQQGITLEGGPEAARLPGPAGVTPIPGRPETQPRPAAVPKAVPKSTGPTVVNNPDGSVTETMDRGRLPPNYPSVAPAKPAPAPTPVPRPAAPIPAQGGPLAAQLPPAAPAVRGPQAELDSMFPPPAPKAAPKATPVMKALPKNSTPAPVVGLNPTPAATPAAPLLPSISPDILARFAPQFMRNR